MIPELIISGEDAKGEFLDVGSAKNAALQLLRDDDETRSPNSSVEETSSFRAIVPFKIKL